MKRVEDATGVAGTTAGATAGASDLVSEIFSYVSSTEDARSPGIFRRWASISVVGAALERRVWVKTGMWTTFCNLFLLFVAPPGTGKHVISTARKLLRNAREPGTKAQAFRVAPTNMTKASLVDELAKAKATRLTPYGSTISYHSLYVGPEEFGSFLSTYDNAYIGLLNTIYNNEDVYDETRRFGTKEVSLENPQINFLSGVQPAFMSNFFPEEVWASGLARRIIMIFSAEKKLVDPFAVFDLPEDLKETIEKKLGRLSQLYGEVTWSREAQDFFQNWVLGGKKPEPSHSKLAGYNNTRVEFLIKLAGISQVSRTCKVGPAFPISKLDIERAMEWLLEAERFMPDVFKAMTGKNDMQVVEELWRFVTFEFDKGGRRGVPQDEIVKFLLDKAPQDKIEAIVKITVTANMIELKDQLNMLYAPKGRHMHREEG